MGAKSYKEFPTPLAAPEAAAKFTLIREEQKKSRHWEAGLKLRIEEWNDPQCCYSEFPRANKPIFFSTSPGCAPVSR